MTWTTNEILLLAGFLLNLLIAIGGWRKSAVENEKTKAETAKLYADMVDKAVEREEKLKRRVDELETLVASQKEEIIELRATIEQKDGRIKELEDLTNKQEAEIRRLRSELDQLKKL